MSRWILDKYLKPDEEETIGCNRKIPPCSIKMLTQEKMSTMKAHRPYKLLI
jgi:hypothetical protein